MNGVEVLLVCNETAYDTEDLTQILLTQFEWWRPGGVVTVSYYSPSRQAQKDYLQHNQVGLHVKLLRNGDEATKEKEVKLVKPRTWQGLSELERLAYVEIAPPEVIRQLMRRAWLLRRWEGKREGPAWHYSTLSAHERNVMDRVIAEKGLQLRHYREPSDELIEWRRKVVAAKSSHAASAYQVRNMDSSLEAMRRNAVTLQKQYETLVAQKEQATVHLHLSTQRLESLLSHTENVP